MRLNVGIRIVAAAAAGLLAVPLLSDPGTISGTVPSRIVEIIADKDNFFKVPGQKKPVITAHPGEILTLRVTSRSGPEKAKDGAVHSICIRALRAQGWDLRLKEGTKDFIVAAPAAPGEYLIECTVKCGAGHEDMRMKLVVQK